MKGPKGRIELPKEESRTGVQFAHPTILLVIDKPLSSLTARDIKTDSTVSRLGNTNKEEAVL